MQPNTKLTTLTDNESKIKQLISELIVSPRILALKWSKITRQTPNIKVGYPGQHLASLIAGIPGEGAGARGNDLIDGTEVKSCSRIDQQDTCRSCKSKVTRFESECPECGSLEIKRNNDSKWLFTIRSEDDLDVLLNKVPRVLLLLSDYPKFSEGDFDTLRFQSFEIWPQNERHRRFREIMENYYYKIYLSHRQAYPTKTPAPKNFWPESYQFYLCNPIKTFQCTITEASTDPTISIDYYVKPDADRSSIPSEHMPSSLMNADEKMLADKLMKKLGLYEVDETIRNALTLRDTDRISVSKNKYSRKSY